MFKGLPHRLPYRSVLDETLTPKPRLVVATFERVLLSDSNLPKSLLLPWLRADEWLRLDEASSCLESHLLFNEAIEKYNNDNGRYNTSNYKPDHPKINHHSLAACIKQQYMFDEKVRIGVDNELDTINKSLTGLIRETGTLLEVKPNRAEVLLLSRTLNGHLKYHERNTEKLHVLCERHHLPESLKRRVNLTATLYPDMIRKADARVKFYRQTLVREFDVGTGVYFTRELMPFDEKVVSDELRALMARPESELKSWIMDQ